MLAVIKTLTPESIILQHAIKRKWKSKEKKHDHWLDYASDKYDKQLISDVKRVLSVLVLFIPVPIFWALFEQQVFSTNCTATLKVD
jgi:hypothetical protein